MHAFMAYDAGGTRHQQRKPQMLIQQRRARESRAMRTVSCRIVESADLPGIFDRFCGSRACQEINDQRIAAAGSERRSSRYVFRYRAITRAEGMLARAVEFPVALTIGRIRMDVRQVIPHPHQMRVTEGVEHRKNTGVSLGRRLLQRT